MQNQYIFINFISKFTILSWKKIEQYKSYILEFLERYASVKAVGYEMLESQVIADEKKHHYQLVEVGWAGIEYVHHCIFHFDIKNGKIWIQLNNTDVSITTNIY